MRILFRILGHWIEMVMLYFITCCVSISVMKETGNSNGSPFPGSTYTVNVFVFCIGILLSCAACSFVWKHSLNGCWRVCRRLHWFWCAAFVLLAVVGLMGMLFVWMIVMFLEPGFPNGGLFDYFEEWVYLCSLIPIVYAVIFPLVEWVLVRRKYKKDRG